MYVNECMYVRIYSIYIYIYIYIYIIYIYNLSLLLLLSYVLLVLLNDKLYDTLSRVVLQLIIGLRALDNDSYYSHVLKSDHVFKYQLDP